jgi:hypothetical protein
MYSAHLLSPYVAGTYDNPVDGGESVDSHQATTVKTDVYDDDSDDCVDDQLDILISYILHSLPYVQAAFNWLFYAYLNKTLRNRHNESIGPVTETSLTVGANGCYAVTVNNNAVSFDAVAGGTNASVRDLTPSSFDGSLKFNSFSTATSNGRQKSVSSNAEESPLLNDDGNGDQPMALRPKYVVTISSFQFDL